MLALKNKIDDFCMIIYIFIQMILKVNFEIVTIVVLMYIKVSNVQHLACTNYIFTLSQTWNTWKINKKDVIIILYLKSHANEVSKIC